MTNENQLAFPAFDKYNNVAEDGLTKLEYFAAAAMQGILANNYKDYCLREDDCEALTTVAVNFAKSLIDKLNENENTTYKAAIKDAE